MNWLDITILIILGLGLIKGLYDGMIKQIVALGALIVGIYLCSSVAEWLHGYLEALEWFPKGGVMIASYFLGFVLVVAIILLAGNIVNRLISATPLSFLNHLGGGVLGLAMTVLFISLIFNVIEMFDTNSIILSQELKIESKYYQYIKDLIPSFFPGKLFPSVK
ncbi:MAG: CvpA family protein [Tannerella sp.]|jgi:membrane protein required for colicin V production|nr:CvpA family protein [Tannerella sp.]